MTKRKAFFGIACFCVQCSCVSFMLLAKQSRYWNAGGNAINVETAGYALLAQLQLGRTGYAGPIVTYITSQRKGGAGFVSTQVSNVRILNTRHDFEYKKG